MSVISGSSRSDDRHTADTTAFLQDIRWLHCRPWTLATRFVSLVISYRMRL